MKEKKQEEEQQEEELGEGLSLIRAISCPNCNNFLVRIVGLLPNNSLIIQCEVCGFIGSLVVNQIPIIKKIEPKDKGASYLG